MLKINSFYYMSFFNLFWFSHFERLLKYVHITVCALLKVINTWFWAGVSCRKGVPLVPGCWFISTPLFSNLYLPTSELAGKLGNCSSAQTQKNTCVAQKKSFSRFPPGLPVFRLILGSSLGSVQCIHTQAKLYSWCYMCMRWSLYFSYPKCQLGRNAFQLSNPACATLSELIPWNIFPQMTVNFQKTERDWNINLE